MREQTESMQDALAFTLLRTADDYRHMMRVPLDLQLLESEWLGMLFMRCDSTEHEATARTKLHRLTEDRGQSAAISRGSDEAYSTA